MPKHSSSAKIRQLYEFASESLMNFRKAFLSDKDDHEPAWFHIEWNDILLNGNKHFAVEGYRESAKSQIVLRGHTLYRLMFPSVQYDYIMLILSNQNNASKKLKEISREYLANPRLSIGLVNVIEDSATAFEINVRNPFTPEAEPINMRVEAHGKGSGAIRGASHYSKRPKLVIIDDPQDTGDASSDAALESDLKWFMSDVKFLGKKSRIFMIGNNLGARCLIERVIKDAEELKFNTMKVPVMYKDENEKWVSSWPGQSSIEQILEEKASFEKIGQSDTWHQNKMCQAIAPERKIFKKEDFRYTPQMPRGNISYYVTVDLAISKNTGADYSAIVVVGVNTENNWFIPEIVFGRYDPTELIDQIFHIYAKYKPICVGVETVAYQRAIQHFLLKEMPKRNIFFNIQPLIAEKSKELRIAMLQPRFRAGQIWFVHNEAVGKPEWLIELELELDEFTPTGMRTGLHDDLIDGLAYMIQIALAPSGWTEKDSEDLPLLGGM